jgi:hypothetical protein
LSLTAQKKDISMKKLTMDFSSNENWAPRWAQLKRQLRRPVQLTVPLGALLLLGLLQVLFLLLALD